MAKHPTRPAIRAAFDDLYADLCDGPQELVSGQMFGCPCIKIGKKAFCVLFGDEMVFKLPPEEKAQALALPGAHLFDPGGKGRAMKEWVQIPAASQGQWGTFAQHALDYVGA